MAENSLIKLLIALSPPFPSQQASYGEREKEAIMKGKRNYKKCLRCTYIHNYVLSFHLQKLHLGNLMHTLVFPEESALTYTIYP